MLDSAIRLHLRTPTHSCTHTLTHAREHKNKSDNTILQTTFETELNQQGNNIKMEMKNRKICVAAKRLVRTNPFVFHAHEYSSRCDKGYGRGWSTMVVMVGVGRVNICTKFNETFMRNILSGAANPLSCILMKSERQMAWSKLQVL